MTETETETETSEGRHFAEEALVDFARQQGGEEQTARMERHLDAGCERCAQTLRLWKAVLGLAGQEASYRPPEAVVGQVQRQFALHRPKGFLERVARNASMVFDSFRQPLPAGVRAAGASPRQLAYKAGRYLIMLRVQPRAGSDRLSVVGQVLDEANPTKALQDAPVLVLRGKETVDRTLTNHLGEFQLEQDPSESLRLCVGAPEVEPLAVLLPSVGPTRGSGWAGPRGPSTGRVPARRRGRMS